VGPENHLHKITNVPCLINNRYINSLVILASGGGENIAPVPIEERIKAELEPVVSYAMLIGMLHQQHDNNMVTTWS
jgi:hypothetical protein